MDTANLGILAGIIISLSTFALIFSVFYLYKREKMAMIERGMDPRIYKQQSAPYQTLKWGLLLMGSGMGLFIAFVLDHKVFTDGGHVAPIYFSMIGIFGGLGLLASFLVEKKQTL